MTIRDALTQAGSRLAREEITLPGLDARLLLGHVLALDALGLVRDAHRSLTDEERARFEALVARRAAGEPVAAILERKEFYGMLFRVSPATLIPRPDSELLVEAALAALPPDVPSRFADFGTGSGCLAAAVASHRPLTQGLAVDVSAAALDVARWNFAMHGLTTRVAVAQADFTKALVRDASLDVILANPPYVSDAEYATLSREVRLWEPRTALTPVHPGGEEASGLECVAALLPTALMALRPGGTLCMEIGWRQGAAALALTEAVRASGGRRFRDGAVVQDLAGCDRMIHARAS